VSTAVQGDQLEKERQKVERGEARLGIMAKAHDDRVVKMKVRRIPSSLAQHHRWHS
jgi:hypothetical protein